jgi:peptidyl-dipeptidase A
MTERVLRSGATVLTAVALVVLTGCATATTPVATPATEPVAAEAVVTPPPAPAGPTLEEARQFINEAETRLLELGIRSNQASWVQANFITEDTQAISAAASEQFITAGVDFAKRASRFDNVPGLTPTEQRKLKRLKLFLTAPAPGDPAKTKELATIASRLEAMYGEGKYCPTPDKCLDVEAIGEIMAESRDPKRLLEVWRGWHTISPAMKQDYARFVELSNEGARELGYKDTGAMWRSKYDMAPDAFAAELDRLWGQVKPLYNNLHCYVRWKLVDKYGSNVVSPTGPIPAHLLGNIWAQEWGNIYDLVAPARTSTGYDLTKQLKAKKVDELEMVRYGERFFSSLGFDPLPKTFWERSLFVKPRDREVVCHASAWDINEVDDLRIKMCIDENAEDFQVIHHELGHNYYQRAYNQQPYLFRDSANDGFHEAVGDTISLSITPSYLRQVGLISKEPPASADIPLLLRDALDKIAFLPFGLLIDQWRWKVFSGEVTPDEYNKAWWELRTKYQGIAPVGERGEEFFDPGAKYHIPGNTPYTRYFLARLLQFQFHRDLCKIAGYEGSLNRCTIYGNKEAGRRLNDMLAMGASRPWQDALQALSGTREMDATAIIDYFAPLNSWLTTQNQGKTCGW